MRYSQFKQIILEDPVEPTQDELEGMKSVIADKIRELPADDATAKALREIEELLQHVNAGGRMGMIYNQLEQINDPTVLAAQKMLSRYLMSIDGTPEERKEFFGAWKSDKVVNVDVLLSKETVTFDKVFNLYTSNNFAKEFIDDIMAVDALGQGRGEFALNVLSKSVWAPESGKGDLQMKLNGKVMHIECKTTMVGAARFTDQEVRPGRGYEAAASELNEFMTNHPTYPIKAGKSGHSLSKAIEFYQNIPDKDRSKFFKMLSNVITLIFGGENADVSDVKKITSRVKLGDVGGASHAWANANFNYYMGKKIDDGVLYTDLNNASFLYYETAEDLADQGVRFHAGTIYVDTVNDIRLMYPQVDIQATTHGASAATKELPKIAKQMNKDTENTIPQKVYDWASKFAFARNESDPATIQGMADMTYELLAQNVSTADIMAELERSFPTLQVAKRAPAQETAPAGEQPAQ